MKKVNWKDSTAAFSNDVMKVFTLFKVLTLIACVSASFKCVIAFCSSRNFNWREKILKEWKSKVSI